MIQFWWWWISAGPGWAEPVQTGLKLRSLRCLSHKHCFLLTPCSTEEDISYLCHTHNLMNTVISALLLSLSADSDSSCSPFASRADPVRTQRRRVRGGSDALALWHCYCFECDDVKACHVISVPRMLNHTLSSLLATISAALLIWEVTAGFTDNALIGINSASWAGSVRGGGFSAHAPQIPYVFFQPYLSTCIVS